MLPTENLEAALQSERLALEPLVEAHAAVLYESLRDESLYRLIPENAPASLEALSERYRFLARRRSPDGSELWLNWALRLRDSGRYAGTLQATLDSGGRAALAYMIFPEFQGRGYAAEGCRRILRELFENRGAKLVFAEMDTRNSASIRLVESLGFKRVSMKKEADFFKGGSSDEYRYELPTASWRVAAGVPSF